MYFSDREKPLKFEAGREFATFLRMIFLIGSRKFLISYTLQQLEFKLEKIMGV